MIVLVGQAAPVHVAGDIVDQAIVHATQQQGFGGVSRRPGAVVSKGELRKQVWANGADDHAVEVTGGRLRRRLGPASDGIETVMRRGYRLAVS